MVFKLVKTVEFSGLPHAADAIQPAHLEACHANLTCFRTVGSACAADKPLAMSSAKARGCLGPNPQASLVWHAGAPPEGQAPAPRVEDIEDFLFS